MGQVEAVDMDVEDRFQTGVERARLSLKGKRCSVDDRTEVRFHVAFRVIGKIGHKGEGEG